MKNVKFIIIVLWVACIAVLFPAITLANEHDAPFHLDSYSKLFDVDMNTKALVYEDSIVLNGDPCSAAFYLEVQDQDSLSYQWYYNGDLIMGETQYQLLLNGQSSFIDGLYQVVVAGSTGVSFTFDYFLEVPLIYSSDTFSICPGDSIFVGIKFWDEPGSYTIKYLDTIDPCQIQLEFFIELNESFEFVTNEAICAGESFDFQGQTYNETGIYEEPFLTQDGCDSNYILQLFVYPDFNDSLYVTICEGNTHEFNGSVYDSDGTYTSYFTDISGCPGSTTLFLSVASIIIGDTLHVTIEDGQSYTFGDEEYTVEGIYSDTLVSSQGCDSVSILQLLTEFPCGSLLPTVETGFGCDSNSGFILIDLDLDEAITFSVDGGVTSQENGYFEDLTEGNFLIIIITEECALNLGTFTLESPPILTGNLSSSNISLGDSLSLSPSDLNFTVESFLWSGDDSINCDTCSSITVAPTITTEYSVILTDENGCEITLNTTVFVEQKGDIYVPNIFTPNDDGVNDKFQLFAKVGNTRTVEKMVIYDRWGNELFRANEFNIGEQVFWDGKIQGQTAGAGVYSYVFLLSDGQIVTGTVTIIR
jgi:gliding motility-associated-like protein